MAGNGNGLGGAYRRGIQIGISANCAQADCSPATCASRILKHIMNVGVTIINWINNAMFMGSIAWRKTRDRHLGYIIYLVMNE